jgi:hypothetical protein
VSLQTALVILLICAAIDLAFCSVLIAFVWVEHRRQREHAAATGQPPSDARGELGCLVVLAALGFVGLYGAAWYLLRG